MNTQSIPQAKPGLVADAGVPEAQLIFDLTQTDLPLDTPVYVYIVGLVAYTNKDNEVVNDFYYLDEKFMPRAMTTNNNTIQAGTFPGQKGLSPAAQQALAVNYPLAWADWGIKVDVGSNLVGCLGNISTGNIPHLGTGVSAFSGRIYVSVGVPKLPFTVQGTATKASGYTAPVFGGTYSGVGGSLTLYDWIEFSYDALGNFNGNTTQVNQFGFSLMLTGSTTDRITYPTQGALGTKRSAIMTTIANGPGGLGGAESMIAVPTAAAEAYPANVGYLRALAPATLNGTGVALNNYYDAVIATAYTAWQSTPLVTTDPATGAYSGVVFPVSSGSVTIATPSDYPAGSIAFYQGSYATMAGLAAAISVGALQPAFYLTGSSNTVTSDDIWQCAGSIASGSTAQKNVGKILGAAFNRGMILDPATNEVATDLSDTLSAGEPASFYPQGGTYNAWAQVFHTYNDNGLAYGFPYDDVCNQNPSIPPPGDTLVAAFIRVALGTFYS